MLSFILTGCGVVEGWKYCSNIWKSKRSTSVGWVYTGYRHHFRKRCLLPNAHSSLKHPCNDWSGRMYKCYGWLKTAAELLCISRDANSQPLGVFFHKTQLKLKSVIFLFCCCCSWEKIYIFLLLLPHLWNKERMSLYGFLGKWCTSFWLLLSERGWRKIFIPPVKIMGVYLCHWLLLQRDLSQWLVLLNISMGYSFSRHKLKGLCWTNW